MGEKTNTTAIVVIPPPEVWEPIEAIRRKHDRQVRRWMPHVTLIYPFRQREDFDALEPGLREACGGIEPFDVKLSNFRHFRHGRGGFTVWLEPTPGEPLIALQEALTSVVPDCSDVREFAGGYAPHLSVGQARHQVEMQALVESLQASWQTISFSVKDVSLIRRGEPPDDVFRVDRTIALGDQPMP